MTLLSLVAKQGMHIYDLLISLHILSNKSDQSFLFWNNIFSSINWSLGIFSLLAILFGFAKASHNISDAFDKKSINCSHWQLSICYCMAWFWFLPIITSHSLR